MGADLIQIRRDTLANWLATNPILYDGEIGIVKDTLKAKVGNGIDNWNTLPYFIQPFTERGKFNMIGNVTLTNIITVSTAIKIAGTTTGGTVEKFTHTSGRLTYNGADSITLFTQFVVSFFSASNATKHWRFIIAKNGIIVATSTQKISSTSNALMYSVTVCDNITFATNDYIEAWLQNDTDTTDLTVDILNFQIN